MGVQDDLKKMGEKTKDAANEAAHKATASAEQAKRDVAGDNMTTGEKAGSMANQAKNEVQGKIDEAKRKS